MYVPYGCNRYIIYLPIVVFITIIEIYLHKLLLITALTKFLYVIMCYLVKSYVATHTLVY